VEALLVTEQTAIVPGAPFTVGLLLRMDPDWHVYWKNPGDSGLPTTIDWSLPPGFAAKALQWPIPERIEQQGLVTYGYSRQVLLPVEIVPPRTLAPGSVVTLRARAGWLACRVECTPGSAQLSTSMPVAQSEDRADPRWTDLFNAARMRLPVINPAVQVSGTSDGQRIVLHAQGLTLPPGMRATFIPSTTETIRDSAPQKAEINGSSLSLQLAVPDGIAPPRELRGIIVFAGQGRESALEVDTALTSSVPRTGSSGSSSGVAGLLFALILAFSGGLLLNLMPCVLPVLSLKVLSFVRSGQAGGGGSLRHGLLYSAGVLVSFWLIAGVLVAFRAGGQLLGWGFQFQNPVVVAVTAAVFFLIGLNLFGVFEIGSSITAVAARAGAGTKGYGSFVSGLFATAVATPCTAPFMGGALGYALTRPMPVAFGVFTALALGLAAPYLVLSAFPGLARRLPKPGRWMETLRQVMGFPMMGAVIWMVFVLESLSGAPGVIALLSALLAAGAGAWVWGRWGDVGRRRGVRIAAACAALVLVLGGPAAATAFLRPARGTPAAAAVSIDTAVPTAGDLWQAWSPEKVAQLRRQAVPVFVDFTARWCITCQVNEHIALDNPAVRDRFRELGVVTLRADWTDRNDLIARALADQGRAGVPLYMWYAPGAAEPVILPEVLTPGIVLAALGPAR
jgi:thiol:disulfide interchange protein DsbD